MRADCEEPSESMAARQTTVASAQEGILLGQCILPCYFSHQLPNIPVSSLAAQMTGHLSCLELRKARTHFKKDNSLYLSSPNTSLPKVAA